jgi:hypothetical protein
MLICCWDRCYSPLHDAHTPFDTTALRVPYTRLNTTTSFRLVRKIRMRGATTPLSLRFIVWYLIKHMCKFTFTLLSYTVRMGVDGAVQERVECRAFGL